MDIIQIEVEKLKRMQMLHVNFFLFDVRKRAEYEASHIPGALHIEPTEFLDKLISTIKIKESPIIIYDSVGDGTALEFARLASDAGYLNIVCLSGGFKSWT